MHPRDVTCSPGFRATAIGEYPALAESRAYARLFGWLCFGTWRCAHTGALMIPAALLTHFERRDHLLGWGNYVGQSYLDAFSRDVAAITLGPWSGTAGVCRTVKGVDFAPAVEEAIEAERASFHYCQERVYLEDGRPVNEKRLRTVREECRAGALERMADAQCQDAARWLRYLNSLQPHRFTKILDNMAAAHAAAWELPDPESRRHALNLLMAIWNQPIPFYQPSPRGRTVRIFGYTESMLGLKKSVRRALTPDWVELDLKSSQASIIARDWDIPSLQAFLKDGGDLWRHLMDGLDITDGGSAKRPLKEAFYATVFGMEERNIAWMLSHEFGQHGFGRRFLNLPLVQDILKARERQMESVTRDGGANDCYGRRIALSEECDARSVLAQCTQAAEMLLLTPVLDMAESSTAKSGFSVVLYQHDGFSMVAHKREDEEHWVTRVQEAVRGQAESLGYETRLERQ